MKLKGYSLVISNDESHYETCEILTGLNSLSRGGIGGGVFLCGLSGAILGRCGVGGAIRSLGSSTILRETESAGEKSLLGITLSESVVYALIYIE